MLKDAIVDARLPGSRFDLVGGMTPGGMTCVSVFLWRAQLTLCRPYADGSKTPAASFYDDNLENAAFSPAIQPGAENALAGGFSPYGSMSPFGGGMSPG